jgi:hypothetical protein
LRGIELGFRNLAEHQPNPLLNGNEEDTEKNVNNTAMTSSHTEVRVKTQTVNRLRFAKDMTWTSLNTT